MLESPDVWIWSSIIMPNTALLLPVLFSFLFKLKESFLTEKMTLLLRFSLEVKAYNDYSPEMATIGLVSTELWFDRTGFPSPVFWCFYKYKVVLKQPLVVSVLSEGNKCSEISWRFFFFFFVVGHKLQARRIIVIVNLNIFIFEFL